MTSETRALAPPPPFPDADRPALFLDFDGTLVEIAEEPHLISVPTHLNESLAALSRRLEGRIAIVSGRAVGNLDEHLDLAAIAAAGSHGGEMRMAGAKSANPLAPIAIEAADAVRVLVGEHEGLMLEEKPYGMAVHYRAAPNAAETVIERLETLAAGHDLAVKRGKMVAELLPRGFNKGAAVHSLMMTEPFEGSLPIFIGDDVTDEDGFAAAAELGGFGILVGPARDTAARYRLEGPKEVYAWLTA